MEAIMPKLRNQEDSQLADVGRNDAAIAALTVGTTPATPARTAKSPGRKRRRQAGSLGADLDVLGRAKEEGRRAVADPRREGPTVPLPQA